MDSLWTLVAFAIVGLMLTVDYYLFRVKKHLDLPPLVDISVSRSLTACMIIHATDPTSIDHRRRTCSTIHGTLMRQPSKTTGASLEFCVEAEYVMILAFSTFSLCLPSISKIEYIVDNTLVTDVLANEADFSFEKGTLSVSC